MQFKLIHICINETLSVPSSNLLYCIKTELKFNFKKSLSCDENLSSARSSVTTCTCVPMYLVLIDAPDADDGVSARSEEAVQSGIQLQRVHTIPVVLLHFISYHIGNLEAHSDTTLHHLSSTSATFCSTETFANIPS